MTRICIDVRCLSEGRRTGVEEYALGLFLNLFELDNKNEYVLFLSAWKKLDFDFSLFSQYPNVKLKKIRIPNKLLNFSFWYFGWPKIDKLVGGADVVFFPNIIFGAVSVEVKSITTIHDLSFERYPGYFSWKRRLWHVFVNPRKICQTANKIITVSHSSAADISSIYGIAKEKISVIPSAIGSNFCVLSRNDRKLIEVKERYNLPFKFILFLGTIEPRKNILGLIEAYNALQEIAIKEDDTELSKYKLVIAGSSGWLSAELFDEIEKSKFKDNIILPGFIASDDMAYVYNLASLFVYPSFFEGFGFPPLEAMGCGVPVITSNNSSLSEVCANCAILIDPHQPGEICEAMRQVLSDKVLREKLIQVGLERARDFTWEKTANNVLEVLNFDTHK
jgi:glycosyltransferase involved in cell wall biosynthesis